MTTEAKNTLEADNQMWALANSVHIREESDRQGKQGKGRQRKASKLCRVSA